MFGDIMTAGSLQKAIRAIGASIAVALALILPACAPETTFAGFRDEEVQDLLPTEAEVASAVPGHHRVWIFHELGQESTDLPQGRQGKFRPDGTLYLIADRFVAEFHRCLKAINDGLQEPLAGERITAQRERTQCGVRRPANLDPPVFDAHTSPAPTAAVRLVSHHASRVNHCTGSAITAQMRPLYLTARGCPAGVNRTSMGALKGCFTCCCCHGWSALPNSCSAFLPGGLPPSFTPTSGRSPARRSTSLRPLSLSRRTLGRPRAPRSSGTGSMPSPGSPGTRFWPGSARNRALPRSARSGRPAAHTAPTTHWLVPVP